LITSLAFALLAEATPALAGGVYLELTGTPVYKKSDRQTSNNTLGGDFDGNTIKPASGLGYDVRGTLGYVFGKLFLLGANINSANQPLKSDAVPPAQGYNNFDKNFEWGPAAGLVWNNFHLIGTYFVNGNRQYQIQNVSGDETPAAIDVYFEQKLKSGGFQLNFGYVAKLSSVFGLGVSLVYKSVTYKSETRVNRLDETQNYTDKLFTSRPVEVSLTPLLALVMSF